MLTSQDIEILKESSLCLVGYGAQGRAEALNLRRSLISFELFLREKGPSWERALSDGFEPQGLEKINAKDKTVVLNLPDQNQSEIYQKFLEAQKPRRLVFAHGFNSHFKLIKQNPAGPSHILVAPKGAASGLIEYFGTPSALPAILAVENSLDEATDSNFALAYARAIGCHANALIWATFKDETVCDLFSEQVLLCGGVSSLIRRSYEVLVEAGYHPEAAYFETVFELKLIVDLIWKNGISGMRDKISPTARFGDITRGDRVIDESVKNRMKEILAEIQDGKFTKEFLSEISSEKFKARESGQKHHAVETIGKRLRANLHEEIKI